MKRGHAEDVSTGVEKNDNDNDGPEEDVSGPNCAVSDEINECISNLPPDQYPANVKAVTALMIPELHKHLTPSSITAMSETHPGIKNTLAINKVAVPKHPLSSLDLNNIMNNVTRKIEEGKNSILQILLTKHNDSKKYLVDFLMDNMEQSQKSIEQCMVRHAEKISAECVIYSAGTIRNGVFTSFSEEFPVSSLLANLPKHMFDVNFMHSSSKECHCCLSSYNWRYGTDLNKINKALNELKRYKKMFLYENEIAEVVSACLKRKWPKIFFKHGVDKDHANLIKALWDNDVIKADVKAESTKK